MPWAKTPGYPATPTANSRSVCSGLKSPEAPAYWTIRVRFRSSTTTSCRVSPTLTPPIRSAISVLPFGDDADGPRGDHQLAVTVPELGEDLAEAEQSGPARLGPAAPRAHAAGEGGADLQRAVVLEVLLGVQSAAALTRQAGPAARPDPLLAGPGPQRVVGVVVGGGHGERRRRDRAGAGGPEG